MPTFGPTQTHRFIEQPYTYRENYTRPLSTEQFLALVERARSEKRFSKLHPHINERTAITLKGRATTQAATLEELAHQLGTTREKIRQAEARGLRIVRIMLHAKPDQTDVLP